jgi:hypothetical protein
MESNHGIDQQLGEERLFTLHYREQLLSSQTSPAKNSSKLLVTLLALFFTLLMCLGVGANLWSDIASQQHPIIDMTLWASQTGGTASPSTTNSDIQATPPHVSVPSSASGGLPPTCVGSSTCRQRSHTHCQHLRSAPGTEKSC